MIRIKDLQFSYTRNAVPALENMSLSLEPGIHLLVGENGAGKTTLLHIIAGLLHPHAGECEIDGVNCSTDAPSGMARVFIVEENAQFPGRTINSFCRHHSPFYPNFSQELFEEYLTAFGVDGNEPLKSMSLGKRKKAQLAYALALGVDVLLLDEPTNGLDIEGRETLKRILAANTPETQTVIVATHSVMELDTLYDGIVVMHRSRLVYAGSTEEISSRISFAESRLPLANALYTELMTGRVSGIYPAEEIGPTAVDWRLLYSGLHSVSRNNILKYLER